MFITNAVNLWFHRIELYVMHLLLHGLWTTTTLLLESPASLE